MPSGASVRAAEGEDGAFGGAEVAALPGPPWIPEPVRRSRRRGGARERAGSGSAPSWMLDRRKRERRGVVVPARARTGRKPSRQLTIGSGPGNPRLRNGGPDSRRADSTATPTRTSRGDGSARPRSPLRGETVDRGLSPTKVLQNQPGKAVFSGFRSDCPTGKCAVCFGRHCKTHEENRIPRRPSGLYPSILRAEQPVPAGLSAGDWSGIRAAHEDWQHRFVKSERRQPLRLESRTAVGRPASMDAGSSSNPPEKTGVGSRTALLWRREKIASPRGESACLRFRKETQLPLGRPSRRMVPQRHPASSKAGRSPNVPRDLGRNPCASISPCAAD